ncbi:MAG: hypothetical protein IH840_12460 [Candidatus Heimdallarchaeota archaeon]|nr:hypothetical protein [Candidatus Heimdallarchaeota archaeon]
MEGPSLVYKKAREDSLKLLFSGGLLFISGMLFALTGGLVIGGVNSLWVIWILAIFQLYRGYSRYPKEEEPQVLTREPLSVSHK